MPDTLRDLLQKRALSINLNEYLRINYALETTDTAETSAGHSFVRKSQIPRDDIRTLDQILSEIKGQPHFSEAVMQIMKQKQMSDSQVYKRADISRSVFGNMKANPLYQPSRETALAITVALQLDLDSSENLLAAAGYSFSSASKTDLIIRWSIAHGIDSVEQINDLLDAYELPRLMRKSNKSIT